MLNRQQQIGLKVEATEGTEEALASANFSGERKQAGGSLEIGEYDRELLQGSLSKREMLKGGDLQTITFQEEMVGGGASTPAPWHTTLRGMGFAASALKEVDVSSMANAAELKSGQVIGDNADQGSATKTGIFFYYSATAGKIVYLPTLGVFADTDTFYNYTTTQAFGDIDSAPADIGYHFAPFSELEGQLPDSVTVERRLGGQRHTVIGARGRGSLSLKHKEPILIDAEFQGVPVFKAADDRTPRLGSFITDVPAVGAPPRLSHGVPLVFRNGDIEYSPVLTEMSIEIDNTLTPRATIGPTPQDTAYLPTRITDRVLNASIDPEHVLPAVDTLDWIKLLAEGATFEMSAQLGREGDTNGIIIIFAPKAQLSGNFDPGDKDGITTAPMTMGFTGTNDDELRIAHFFL